VVHVANCGIVVNVTIVHCYMCVCVARKKSTHVIENSKVKNVVLEEVKS
jgi:hypothetical protein